MTVTHYDPETTPDPQEWLALDEQKQIELIQSYHSAASVVLQDAHRHAVSHAIVEGEIAKGPGSAAAALARLQHEGLSRHESVHAVASIVAEKTFRGRVFWPQSAVEEEQRQLNAELEALSAKSWEGQARPLTDQRPTGSPPPTTALQTASGKAVLIRLDIAPAVETAQGYSEDAVRNMQRMYGAVMDYSVDSLVAIDRVLSDWRKKGATADVAAKSLYAFGCYAGEVLQRQRPGHWQEPPREAHGDLESLFLYVRLHDGREWRPIAIAFLQMMEGPQYSLHASLNRLVEQ